MKREIQLFFLLGILFTLTFCSKMNQDIEVEPNTIESNVEMVLDDAAEIQSIVDIMNEIDEIISQFDDFGFKSIESSGGPNCRVVTKEHLDSTQWFPLKLTIDFGDKCNIGKGNTKSGKIIVIKDGNYKKVGSTRIQTFEDFYVNGNKYEGTRTYETTAADETGITWAINNDIKIIREDSLEVQRVIEHERKWSAGFDTKEPEDDEWTITGTTYINRSNGVAITRTIIEPILRARSCDYIMGGTVELAKEGISVSLNYGEGECDEYATLTVGEESVEVDLSKKWSRWTTEQKNKDK